MKGPGAPPQEEVTDLEDTPSRRSALHAVSQYCGVRAARLFTRWVRTGVQGFLLLITGMAPTTGSKCKTVTGGSYKTLKWHLGDRKHRKLMRKEKQQTI